jgi:Manganese containing catalase
MPQRVGGRHAGIEADRGDDRAEVGAIIRGWLLAPTAIVTPKQERRVREPAGGRRRQGSCWTPAYIQEGGNVVRDLQANISAEAGARQTYESPIKACDDEGTKKTLRHLLTREITHANMFMKALDAMGKLDDPFFGNIPPDETVKLVFNLSRRARTCAVLGMRGLISNMWPIPFRKGACLRPRSTRTMKAMTRGHRSCGTSELARPSPSQGDSPWLRKH